MNMYIKYFKIMVRPQGWGNKTEGEQGSGEIKVRHKGERCGKGLV